MIRFPSLPAVALGLAAVACGDAGGASSRGGPHTLYIVATTGMIGDAAARVAGDAARVEALMGPGVDPHLYKTTAADARRLAEADLILHNGLHLEGKMGDILEKMGRQKPVRAVSASLPPDRLRHPPEFSGLPDPHIWFDVALWIGAVAQVEDALAAADPGRAAECRARGKAYRAELEALDVWVRSRITEIPDRGRILVTAHDAFGYFGRAYGLEVVGLQGVSTVADFSIKDVERIAELLVSRNVRAVFVETSISRQSIEAVVRLCEARGHRVAIGGSLFSDAMGPAGTPEGTYIGMVRHNVNTIVDALK